MSGIVKVSYLVSVPGANQGRRALLYSAPVDSPEQASEFVYQFLAENKELDAKKASAVFVPHSVWIL